MTGNRSRITPLQVGQEGAGKPPGFQPSLESIKSRWQEAFRKFLQQLDRFTKMTLSSSGLEAGFKNTPVLTFHPGPIMKQLLIVSWLLGKQGKEAYCLGTGFPAKLAASRYHSRRETNRLHLKLLSLLPPLLCQDECLQSTVETPVKFGKLCISLAWRSDPHLLKALTVKAVQRPIMKI